MIIETRKIDLGVFHVKSSGKDRILSSPRNYNTHKISPMQEQMLEKISSGRTLELIALESFKNQEEFSFRELYKLMEILMDLQIIIDTVVRNYFEPEDVLNPRHEKTTRDAPTVAESPIGHWNSQHLADLPFFRNLPLQLLNTFIGHAVIEKVPERTQIIKYEDTARDLFVIFKGEASIYIPGVKHRHLITTIPAGSVFGEGAFFFNQPRTADVISNVPCVFARIRYDEQAFHGLIHSANTHQLQKRLWILHGLLSSPLFHHVPSETLDRFALTGVPHTYGSGQEFFKEGDKGNSFFVVIQGQVELYVRETLIKTLKQGEMFGEIALMINSGERTATAKAMGETMLLEVQRDEFYKVLSQNLVLAKQIEEIAIRRFNDLVS